ncbi:hypothetical protein ACFWBC_40165, partial [Streptomyces sp. NPDC059985]|uniref:hypothetical protein n=1 Tax=Streptomyces sp. NPDC059985 TaxID=3347025 RepID=UPI0036AA36C0
YLQADPAPLFNTYNHHHTNPHKYTDPSGNTPRLLKAIRTVGENRETLEDITIKEAVKIANHIYPSKMPGASTNPLNSGIYGVNGIHISHLPLGASSVDPGARVTKSEVHWSLQFRESLSAPASWKSDYHFSAVSGDKSDFEDAFDPVLVKNFNGERGHGNPAKRDPERRLLNALNADIERQAEKFDLRSAGPHGWRHGVYGSVTTYGTKGPCNSCRSAGSDFSKMYPNVSVSFVWPGAAPIADPGRKFQADPNWKYGRNDAFDLSQGFQNPLWSVTLLNGNVTDVNRIEWR